MYFMCPVSLMGIIIVLGSFMFISTVLSISLLVILGALVLYKYLIFNYRDLMKLSEDAALPALLGVLQ